MTYLEEVVNVLRRSHPSLMTEVERMLDELARRFRVEPEEELLSNLHALLLKCYKAPLLTEEAVPPVIQSTLEKVYRTYFIEPQPVSTSSQKRYAAFIDSYKARFEFDFIKAASPSAHRQFPVSLSDLLTRFQRWKAHLHAYLHSQPALSSPRLERLSSYLVQFSSHDIEVPGQYMHDREPILDHHVILARFSPDVAIPHAATGTFHRRIGMVGDDGRQYHFLMQFAVSHITHSDERLMQLYTLLNRFIKQYKQTRQRQLQYHVPVVIPLTHRLRLAATHPSAITLDEVYEQASVHAGIDPLQALVLHRDGLKGAPSAEQDFPTRLRLYNDITTTLVPDTLLSSFFHRAYSSLAEFHAFKLEFARQCALTGYLSYLLKIGDRAPHKLCVLQNTGRLYNTEFYATYNEQQMVECSEPVPFRLTRNMTQLLGQSTVDGLLSAVLQSLNSGLLSNGESLKNFLSLLIRDDLLSFSTARTPLDSDAMHRMLERSYREKVMQNVNNVLRRMHNLVANTTQQQQSAAQQNGSGAQQQPQAASTPINHKVAHMIKIATAKSKLCMMQPTWAPWF